MQARRWSINDAKIWAERRAWAQSGDFYDNDAHLHACIDADWQVCLQKGAARLIENHDSCLRYETALEDTLTVLYEFKQQIYSMFDYYASLGSSSDVVRIQVRYKVLHE